MCWVHRSHLSVVLYSVASTLTAAYAIYEHQHAVHWLQHPFHSFYRATLCCRRVSVCPSVSPSQAGTVSKCLNVKSRTQLHTIAQGTLVFWRQRSRRKSNRGWFVAQWLERWSLTGELSLSHARPACSWRVTTYVWVRRPLQVSQLGQLSLSSWVVSYFIGCVPLAPSGECSRS